MFILKQPKWCCQKQNSVCTVHDRKVFQNKMYSLLCCNILIFFPPQNAKTISVSEYPVQWFLNTLIHKTSLDI